MTIKSWFILVLFLGGCMSDRHVAYDFVYVPIAAGDFEVATWQKITNSDSPIHIYIEGDGHAFDGHGMPTNNPTPIGTMVRDLAMSDAAENVVYMARPCQFIMSDKCNKSDWTDGRFSKRIIDSMAVGIKSVSGNRDIILIGYSGGAMVSGLVIVKNPDLKVKKWITIAGVLNHDIWTDYFGDSPLLSSMSLDKLPNVPQVHYVAENDNVVPLWMTQFMANDKDIVIVRGATHNNFKNLEIDFN